MGFRSTGNEVAIRNLTPSHRRAIVAAEEAVNDGALCYWAPSFKAVRNAETMGVARQEQEGCLLMALTAFGKAIREDLKSA